MSTIDRIGQFTEDRDYWNTNKYAYGLGLELGYSFPAGNFFKDLFND